MHRSSRSGFTLIELLVVISIIAVLVALLIPAIGLVQNMQKKADAQAHIEGLKAAVDQYLAEEAILGEDASAGTHMLQDYLSLLVHWQEDPLLDLNTKVVCKNTTLSTAGPYNPVKTLDEATHVRDKWGWPIRMQIVNEAMPGLANRTHTTQVLIRCTVGSQSNPNDDIVHRWDMERKIWEPVRITDEAGDIWTVEAKK